MTKKVWVDDQNHMGSMVCFGIEKDHLVLSPFRAKELGQELINAADKCMEDWNADQRLSGMASDGEGSESE